MSISNVNAALATYQYAVKAQKTSAKGTAFADKVMEIEEAGSTPELSDAEKLEAFKKEIWNEINSYPWNPSISESIQITDGAFQRMMEDSDFKDRMLNVLYKDAVVARPPICAGITWIDESGYSGYSYNDKQAGEIAFQAHSNHKDSFYVHKAKKKNDSNDLTEYYEKQRRERELQQELRDKAYFQNKELTEYWNKRQSAAASYEANVIEDSVEISGFDSAITGTNA